MKKAAAKAQGKQGAAAKPAASGKAKSDVAEPPSIDHNPIGFLVAPTSIADFDSEHWEKKALYVAATSERKEFFKPMFSFDDLKVTAKARCEEVEPSSDEDGSDGSGSEDSDDDMGPLLFGSDVNAARYVNGVKEIPDDEVATEQTLQELFEKGFTFQVIQPQRFDDDIWRLVSALEQQLGCLVGCNAYLTPAGAQGLAPHYDDVELWICQTQGSKTWRLYAPMKGFTLPNRPSPDYTQEQIGEPVMEVTLNVGDVLYLPRGTIHQAVAQEEGATHLTLSTYQGWSWGDFTTCVLRTALDAQGQVEGVELPIELRRSLPRRFLFNCGLQAELEQGPGQGSSASQEAARTLAAGLRALADQLESKPQGILPAAADAFAADFIRARIRPHPSQLRDEGPPPSSLDDALIGRGKGLFMIVPVEAPEDPEVPEGFVKLCTPLRNSRCFHMIANPGHVDHEFGDGSEDGSEDHEGCDHEHGQCGHEHGHKKAGEGEEKSEGEDADEGEDESGSEGGEGEGSDDDDDEGEDSDDEDDETGLPGPVVPAAYAPLVAEILGCTAEPGITLRSLVSKAPHQDEEEVLRLAFSLWQDGFVSTLPAASKKAEGKKAEGKKVKEVEGEKAEPKKAEAKKVEGKKAKPEVKQVEGEKAEAKKAKPEGKKAADEGAKRKGAEGAGPKGKKPRAA